MRMSNFEKAVVIARGCSFREIKNMINNSHTDNMEARYNKHEGGKTISRRDTEKEKAYGETKHYITLLNKAKEIKSSWESSELREFVADMKDVDSFISEIKTKLRASYNKIQGM